MATCFDESLKNENIKTLYELQLQDIAFKIFTSVCRLRLHDADEIKFTIDAISLKLIVDVKF